MSFNTELDKQLDLSIWTYKQLDLSMEDVL